AELAGARRLDARGAEAGRRGRAAAHAARARREERGEDPQGPGVQAGQPRRGPAPARRGAACRAGRGLRLARPPGRGARLRGRLGAPAQGDVPRSRHHRDRHRSRRAHVVLHAALVGRGRRRSRRHEGDRHLERRAARRRELPERGERSDLRGDLHTHTHWSADGKSTLEEMVVAAAARGYEYYAITDHSHYLREGRLVRQLEEIEELRERYPKLRILAGVEANIRTNGEVDVSEEELARLDWVVASVHQAPENRPTERVLEAMENPHVHCIGHLTGRRIGTRGPRDVDVARVIEKALATGCFLEINGQPDRLDLRDVNARAAKEAGLKLAISSDG